MARQGVLLLHNATHREVLWFLYEELADLFPPENPQWGDVFLTEASVEPFKTQQRDQLHVLLERL